MKDMDVQLKQKFDRIKQKNIKYDSSRSKNSYMDPKLNDIYGLINHPSYHIKRRNQSKTSLTMNYQSQSNLSNAKSR